jgi:hypothetical protein
MVECNRWFLLNQAHEAGMTQANLLEGVKISGNRPQTYKIELKKTYLFGTNHLNSSVWYNPIPKASTARKIFRRALATDFQGNQVNLLFDTILAHIAPHCTHKVANISQCSPIAGLYSSCRIVAPVVGLLACTCSCRFGRRSGLAATIPTLILITESCLLPSSKHGSC